MTAALII